MLTLQRLLPGPDQLDALDAYQLPPQPYLRANMVSSVDGAATMGGRVGTLTGAADQVLLRVLRSLADVLLVGAGTVRGEGYGPVRCAPEAAAKRAEAGQLPAARLAVVTHQVDLDLTSTAFTEAPVRPIVITCGAAPQEKVDAAAEVADVIVAGDDQVDLPAAVRRLYELGLPRILSEGGPRLLADLFAADLVDELCWAVSPLVVGGGSESRITNGALLDEPMQLRLGTIYEVDDYLFLRYHR
ncbi:pyrimidine reductase family protein [Nocardioides sp. Bht2]|uniref:pyrimidine reductase family protein n=1 Tax=Nocardioides sp. Bht2 TaxID=3392297 RepID=UPI0039B437B7